MAKHRAEKPRRTKPKREKTRAVIVVGDKVRARDLPGQWCVIGFDWRNLREPAVFAYRKGRSRSIPIYSVRGRYKKSPLKHLRRAEKEARDYG